ncbi:MAG: N-acetylmuramoyl-L-alanine amidase [Bacteroidales bacterium]|nr:N-acetylmuramoyl-L-alanine amidase [Bacteroidales bacterium]
MNSKIAILFCLILTFFINQILGQNTTTSSTGKVSKIVLDAGHGGDDPGALGKRAKEKDINLAVILKVGKLIRENYSDVEVLYTRQKDVSVDLYKRARYANENHADLFISVHCNASTNFAAHGVETYVMGLHRSEANLAVARQENAAILKEKNHESNYEGFDPNSPEASVIFSLYASTYLKNSAILAAAVQKNLITNTRLYDRNIQQAGFWVLYKVAMPSILIELGFVSNYNEESILMDEKAQNTMAKSIYNAFVEYKNKIEGTDKKGLDIEPINKNKIISNTLEEEKKEEEKIKKEQNSTDSLQTIQNDSVDVHFRIQIYASPDDLAFTDPKFKNFTNLNKYSENNWWKYTTGDAKTLKEAKELLAKVKENGFPDAFIVAFNKEKKITISEAIKLTDK